MDKSKKRVTKASQSKPRVNRNYKAGVFSHLFGDPKNKLELYNAFSPVQYPPDTPVVDLTLTDVMYMDRVNDLSFSIGDKLIVFFEHSSSINENMPLRYLTYCGRVYEMLVDNETMYSEKRVAIPTPEFYVLYNGIKPFPEKAVYRLSDSFAEKPSGDMPLELIVTAYNVNKGFNDDIINRSSNLSGYVTLVSKVREYEDTGLERTKAVAQAIKDCMAQGVLSSYLKRNASEVRNMLIQDWDWDVAKRVWQREAREEGVAVGERRATRRANRKWKARVAEKESALAEKDSALAEKDSALVEKETALVEKDSALAEKDSELAEKDAEIAMLRAKLNSQ